MKEGFRSGKIVTVKKVSKGQKSPQISAKWLCKCDCGNEKIVSESALYCGSTRSCGCIVKRNKDEDYYERTKKRILKSVYIDDKDCWIWTGGKHRQGYGSIGFYNKPSLAHRISWIVFKGEIPTGIKICHKCDVTSCVNPEHLFLGTQKDNVTDCVEKGNFRNRKLGKRRNKLNWDQVQEIKKLSECGMTRKELQFKFQVSQTCIAKILTERSWMQNWSQEL